MSLKISNLPAASSANLTDLFEKTNDPSGTPQTQRMTLGQIKTLLDTIYQQLLGFTPLNPANNLSDLQSAATSRANLGLGSAAVKSADSTGASGTIPLLDGSGNLVLASGSFVANGGTGITQNVVIGVVTIQVKGGIITGIL